MHVEHEVSAPRASSLSASGAPGSVYDYNALFDTGSAPTILYGAVELYDYDPDTRLHKVKQPTEDSLPWQVVAFLPGAQVAPSADPPCYIALANFMLTMRPVIACLDAGSDAVTIGDNVGTLAGSYGLKKDNTGFVVVGVIQDDSPDRFILVRPSGQGGGGGGGTTFTIVQALGDGFAGVVSVKAIAMLPFVGDHPNFEQTGSSIDLNYFNL